MNDWTASQIKELVKIELESERRLRDSLRVEDRERFDDYKKQVVESLRVATEASNRDRAELERRLGILNHAHEEAQRVLSTYLPRELYERTIKEWTDWRGKLDLKVADMETRLNAVVTGVANLPGGIRSIEVGLAAQAAQSTGSRMTQTTAIVLAGTFIAALGGLIALLNYLGK